MADQKVTDITAVATPAATDTLYVVQGSTDKKATISQYIAVGATDNAVVRADGTGTATVQGSSVIINDAAASNVTVTTPAGTAVTIAPTAPATAASTTAGVGVTLTASAATAGNTNAGAAAGGAVTITAGNAARFTSGNANGGAVTISAGTGIGTGTSGNVTLSGAQAIIPNGTAALPGIAFNGASNAGFYNNSGTIEACTNGVSRWKTHVTLGDIYFTGGNLQIIGSNASATTPGYTFQGDLDTGIGYAGANAISMIAGGASIEQITTTGPVVQGGNGATWQRGFATELLTLSTSGTTTDTSANLLPANSIIEAVVARVTTTITTATNWKLGDATTAGRFTAANGTLTAGTTDIGLVHIDQTGAAGPRQTAAAKVRVTCTGTPGAGAVRITVFYRQFVAPTS